jgi:hypothetical protein
VTAPGGLLLFPGAGSSSTHPSLIAIEHAVAPLPCRRVDFPYRLAGRKAPDRAPVLLNAVREAASAMTRPLLLGGRSMGGRMCSLAVGDALDPLPAAGLVLICYPLHPPGKPDQLRVEHFPRLTVPCLFVSGTKDAFGSPDELQRWTATIAAPVSHHWLEGKGHDLKGCDQAISGIVAGWIATTFSAGRARRGGAERPGA